MNWMTDFRTGELCSIKIRALLKKTRPNANSLGVTSFGVKLTKCYRKITITHIMWHRAMIGNPDEKKRSILLDFISYFQILKFILIDWDCFGFGGGLPIKICGISVISISVVLMLLVALVFRYLVSMDVCYTVRVCTSGRRPPCRADTTRTRTPRQCSGIRPLLQYRTAHHWIPNEIEN